MIKCSYKEGISWCVDEMKAFRLTLKQLRERLLVTEDEVSKIEEYLEYGAEDVLVLIPGYNISWFGKMKLVEGFVVENEEDQSKQRSIDKDKPLWKMFQMTFHCGRIYMIPWQVYVDYLNKENLDYPKYMNVTERRNIKMKTLGEILYR